MISRSSFSHFDASAVHDLGVGVAEELKHPERIGCPPVVAIAVEDHGRLVGHAEPSRERLECLPAEVVATDLVVQVACPVDFCCARNVTRRVEQRILIRLDDPDVGVFEMGCDPVGRNQDVRVCVTAGLRYRSWVNSGRGQSRGAKLPILQTLTTAGKPLDDRASGLRSC